MEQLFSAFASQQYEAVLTAAEALDQGSPIVQRFIGISLLRLTRFEEAEPWLLRAYAQDDQEGTVEYGNLLRATGRLQDALRVFQAVSPSLSGELQLRCLRWWGITQYLLGDWAQGLSKCERSWLGYLSMHDEETASKIAQNLAIIYRNLGNYAKAEKYLKQCLSYAHTDGNFRLNLCVTLADLYIEMGDVRSAERYITDGEAIRHLGNMNTQMHLLASRASLLEITGIDHTYGPTLEEIYRFAKDDHQYDLLIWSSMKLIDYLSQRGDFTQALKIVYAMGMSTQDLPTELALAKALIHRRQGDLVTAIRELEQIRASFATLEPNKNSITALLHLGFAYYMQQDFEHSLAALREALEGFLRLDSHTAFKPVLEEMSELLHYAALEPSLAPYLEPVMDSMADLLGNNPRAAGEQIRVQVYTFGQVSVAVEGTPVQLSLRGSVPLLAYLALRPNRTRAELQNDLYPDKEPDAASAYVRQSIRELRERLGRDVIVHEGPHNQPRYRLGGTVRLDLDLQRFDTAVQQGELARALALYRGEFLPGFEESEWVRTRREEARLSLAFELRNQIARFMEEREWRRVILLANQYLRVDPYDQEVLGLRVEAAHRVGSAAELARYVAQFKAMDN